MLDTDACRLDVAEIVRVAKQKPDGVTRWTTYRGQSGPLAPPEEAVLDLVSRHDAQREVLVIDDWLEVDLERQRIRVPSCGRTVPGPVLARCPRGCGRRARVLWIDYRDPELFPTCRECARVEYATAKATEVERARLGYERLRRKLGVSRYGGHERRPYQRRRAHQRDAERLAAARERLRAAEARELAQIVRAMGGPRE
jgi:hypothetical protein